eukprot:TRINITY_DN23028_c0_g1_i1.p1 TRINITY_DN23028_c0_g1~~TRINITY_DN23028_c0_g1_i1.p1  ORF type:complete len:691 (+),score=130.75 TRINITY_DN23028_c0_g1_i1:541-2613(+)
MLLTYLRMQAEAYLNRPVSKAVVTIPARFGPYQQYALLLACQAAKLSVLGFLKSPTASSIAWHLVKKRSDKRNTLVCNAGASYFDFALLEMAAGCITEKFYGTDLLDFDDMLVDYCLWDIQKRHPGPIPLRVQSLDEIRFACERAKKKLSVQQWVSIDIPDVASGVAGCHIVTISRGQFEELIKPTIDSLLRCVAFCLEDAELARGDVDEVLLVGGACRVPLLQSALQDFFHGLRPCQVVHPEHSAVLGAAAFASLRAAAARKSQVSSREGDEVQKNCEEPASQKEEAEHKPTENMEARLGSLQLQQVPVWPPAAMPYPGREEAWRTRERTSEGRFELDRQSSMATHLEDGAEKSPQGEWPDDAHLDVSTRTCDSPISPTGRGWPTTPAHSSEYAPIVEMVELVSNPDEGGGESEGLAICCSEASRLCDHEACDREVANSRPTPSAMLPHEAAPLAPLSREATRCSRLSECSADDPPAGISKFPASSTDADAQKLPGRAFGRSSSRRSRSSSRASEADRQREASMWPWTAPCRERYWSCMGSFSAGTSSRRGRRSRSRDRSTSPEVTCSKALTPPTPTVRCSLLPFCSACVLHRLSSSRSSSRRKDNDCSDELSVQRRNEAVAWPRSKSPFARSKSPFASVHGGAVDGSGSSLSCGAAGQSSAFQKEFSDLTTMLPSEATTTTRDGDPCS